MELKISTPTLVRPWLLLLFILALGWWLRVDGNHWGLPFRLHPDEMKYVAPAARVYQGEWNPKYFRNPPGFTYLTASWYPAWMLLGSPVEIPEWLNIPPNRLEPTFNIPASLYYRPFDLVFGARHLAALLGVLSLFVLYLIARDLFSTSTALIAAALHAVSFIGVRECHFAVNDASMTLFTLLVLWLGFRMVKRDSWRYAIGASLAAGAAVAMKYNAFPVVIALVILRAAALFYASDTKPWGRVFLNSAIIGSLALMAFLVICPFPFTDPETFWAEISDLAQKAEQTWPGQEKTWSGFLLVKTLFTSEGIPSLPYLLCGITLLSLRREWTTLVFPVLYALLVCTHSLYFMRFSMPLLPWLALWTAYGIDSTRQAVSLKLRLHWVPQWVFALALVVGCMVLPLNQTLRSNLLFKQTDTRIEFLRWMLTENQAQARVAVDQYAVPLLYRGAAEPWGTLFDPRLVPIDRLESENLHQLDSFTDLPVGQIAVSSFAAFPGYLRDTYEERRHVLMAYFGSSEPIKVFQPFISEWQPRASNVEDTYNPVDKLFDRHQPGPMIEVFSRPIPPPSGQ